MIKEFIKNLGGFESVAVHLTTLTGKKVDINAVYQWPYRGQVPHRWRFYIAKLAKKKRIKDVPPELLGYMQ